MIDIKKGRQLLAAATKRPWNRYIVAAAGEEGSGGWQCDRDRQAIIWAINNISDLLDELEQAREK